MQKINLYFIPVPNRTNRFHLYHITGNGFLCAMSAADIVAYKDTNSREEEDSAIKKAGYSIDKNQRPHEMRYFIKAYYSEELLEWVKKNIKSFASYQNVEKIEVFQLNGFNPYSIGVVNF
jgi:hypothetical protein